MDCHAFQYDTKITVDFWLTGLMNVKLIMIAENSP